MFFSLLALSLLMAGIFVGHAVLAASFIRQSWRTAQPPAVLDYPRVAVILCLRGHDATLERCLEGLLNQDFPHYQVMIVVDQCGDSAWEVAARAVERNAHISAVLRPLLDRRPNCSLKCSAIVQAVSELEARSQVEVYAFLDQDVIPHRSWLKELAAPLADRAVAASCGYRWFAPQRRTLPAIIRAQWNAGSIGLMALNGICWGGSLAVKADFLRRARLLERWSHALCEDTMIGVAARQHKLRIALLPSLLMVHHETCSTASLFAFMFRQTLFAFLYNPGFRLRNQIVTICYNATLASALVLTCVAAAHGNGWCVVLGALLGSYVSLLLGAHWLMETITVAKMQQRGMTMRRPDAGWLLLLLLCFPLTQLSTLVVVVGTIPARNITWRGVRYTFRGPWQVERANGDSGRMRR